MAGSVNKVILIGHCGKDPDVRRTQDGRPIVNLSIATSETWKDKGTGERKEKTEWHRVVIFNEGLCKVAEQYLAGLGIRAWDCSLCGASHDRDVNAARNILALALSVERPVEESRRAA